MSARQKAVTRGPWADLASRSLALRKSVEALTQDTLELWQKSRGDPVTCWQYLDEELRRWKESVADASDQVRPLAEQSGAEKQEFVDYLEDKLRRELGRRGLQVFGDAGVLFVDGIVDIEVDRKKVEVRINSAPAADLSMEGLCSAVADRLSMLRKVAVDPGKFLVQLARAYDRELRIIDRPAGTQVPILSILGHLLLDRQTPTFRANPTTRGFKEYSREQYRSDLHGLLVSGRVESEGRRLRYASGSDTVGAIFMYVPSLERTAHVGRMWFEAT